MLPNEVVVERRRYATHLGLDLREGVRTGDVADADHPIHAEHALLNFVGSTGPTVHPINMGLARVVYADGRYTIRWPANG